MDVRAQFPICEDCLDECISTRTVIDSTVLAKIMIGHNRNDVSFIQVTDLA